MMNYYLLCIDKTVFLIGTQIVNTHTKIVA